MEKNIFPKIEIIHIPERLCRVGRFFNRLVLGPHLLSPISDHEFVHPLDDVFDTPVYTDPEQRMNEYWGQLITHGEIIGEPRTPFS